MDLTPIQRLILINQYTILEHLDPHDTQAYSQNRKALQGGFKLHYSSLLPGLLEDEMSDTECRQILDILEMHRAMHDSYSKLADKSAVPADSIRFRGFDGNEEPREYSYANFYLNDLGRYKELWDGKESAYINSHAPMMPRYRSMLEEWKNFGRSFELSAEQIEKVTKATSQ